MTLPLIPPVLKFLNDNGPAMSALSGVIVAVFTGTLWWVTWGLVRVGKEQRYDTLKALKISEIAANAAKSSADASVAAERAYLFLASIDLVKVPTTIHFEKVARLAKLTFHNYGRTPANIIEYHCFMRALDHEPGPNDEEPVTVKDEAVAVNYTIMLGAGEPWRPFPVNCWEHEKHCFGPQGELLSSLAFYVWGRVTYRTLFNITGETYFKRKWVEGMDWVSVGTFDENAAK